MPDQAGREGRRFAIGRFAMKQHQYFVLYDYGQGGAWAVVEASRKENITERFPELQVFDKRPGWMTDDQAARLEAGSLDLERPSGLLADILKERS